MYIKYTICPNKFRSWLFAIRNFVFFWHFICFSKNKNYVLKYMSIAKIINKKIS